MDGLNSGPERLGALEPEKPTPPTGKLPIQAPPQIEEAIGYEGGAEWLSPWWEVAGDEAMYSDGHITTEAEWHAYLLWVRHNSVAPYLEGFNLGSSDRVEEHRLLIHRPTRQVYVETSSKAIRTITDQ